MSNIEYKIEVYDVNGDYISDISEKASFGGFDTSINSGISIFMIRISDLWDVELDTAEKANEIKVYEQKDSDPRLLCSGYVKRVRRAQSRNSQEFVIECAGYASRFRFLRALGTGNTMSIDRDQTYSADPGSLDSGQASDMFKLMKNIYRWRNSEIAVSNEQGTNGYNFGSTRRLTQSFTTGTDEEQNLITGVELLMQWNNLAGTAGRIDVAIKADDGTDRPTGSNLAISRVGAWTDTGLRWVRVLFDTPLQLSNSTKYHIVVVSSGTSITNGYKWQADTGANNYYPDGKLGISTDGGATWNPQTNADAQFRTLYADDSRVRITENDSIDDSGDSKNWKITNFSIDSALEYIRRYGKSQWYWYLDEDNVLHYHPVGYEKAYILSDCDADTGWSVVQSDASTGNVDETSATKIEGSGALAMSIIGGVLQEFGAFFNMSSMDISDATNIGPWMYIDQEYLDLVAELKIQIGTTNSSTWYINPALIKGNQWNWLAPLVELTTPPNETTGTGADLSSVTDVSIKFKLKVSGTSVFSFYLDDLKAGRIVKHDISLVRDAIDIEFTEQDIEDLVNSHIFTNNDDTSPITRIYQNESSIDEIGIFEDTRVDNRFTVVANMDEVGNNYISERSMVKKGAIVRVPTNSPYLDTSAIKPGHLVSFRDYGEIDAALYYVVLNVNYQLSDTIITVSELGTNFDNQLSELEKRMDLLESRSGSTGDTPSQGLSQG